MIKFWVIFLCLFSFVNHNNEEGSNELIWSKKVLTWAHFKGIVPDSTFEHEAITTSSLPCVIIQKNNKLIYSVTAVFNLNESWTITNSDYALNHEQRHFDITEIYARKIRKCIYDDIRLKKDFEYIESHINIFSDSMSYMQDYYDQQTNFGIDSIMQKKWNKKIDKMLNDLKIYIKTTDTLKIYSNPH